jgi:YggT family protein
MDKLVQIVLLIANTCCTFFSALLLMRFFMQLVRAPFDGPAGGFVLTLTHWLVLPLRRVVPAIRRLDTASLLAAYLLQILLLALVVALSPGHVPSGVETAARIAIGALFALARAGIYLYIILLLAQAVFSWFQSPYSGSPASRLLSQMTAPVLRPLRRFIPPVSGIDLAPLVALLLAQILLILI